MIPVVEAAIEPLVAFPVVAGWSLLPALRRKEPKRLAAKLLLVLLDDVVVVVAEEAALVWLDIEAVSLRDEFDDDRREVSSNSGWLPAVALMARNWSIGI